MLVFYVSSHMRPVIGLLKCRLYTLLRLSGDMIFLWIFLCFVKSSGRRKVNLQHIVSYYDDTDTDVDCDPMVPLDLRLVVGLLF